MDHHHQPPGPPGSMAGNASPTRVPAQAPLPPHCALFGAPKTRVVAPTSSVASVSSSSSDSPQITSQSYFLPVYTTSAMGVSEALVTLSPTPPNPHPHSSDKGMQNGSPITIPSTSTLPASAHKRISPRQRSVAEDEGDIPAHKSLAHRRTGSGPIHTVSFYRNSTSPKEKASILIAKPHSNSPSAASPDRLSRSSARAGTHSSPREKPSSSAPLSRDLEKERRKSAVKDKITEQSAAIQPAKRRVGRPRRSQPTSSVPHSSKHPEPSSPFTQDDLNMDINSVQSVDYIHRLAPGLGQLSMTHLSTSSSSLSSIPSRSSISSGLSIKLTVPKGFYHQQRSTSPLSLVNAETLNTSNMVTDQLASLFSTSDSSLSSLAASDLNTVSDTASSLSSIADMPNQEADNSSYGNVEASSGTHLVPPADRPRRMASLKPARYRSHSRISPDRLIDVSQDAFKSNGYNAVTGKGKLASRRPLSAANPAENTRRNKVMLNGSNMNSDDQCPRRVLVWPPDIRDDMDESPEHWMQPPEIVDPPVILKETNKERSLALRLKNPFDPQTDESFEVLKLKEDLDLIHLHAPKRARKIIPRQQRPVANVRLASDDNDDHCSACFGAGELLCCESCPRSFHPYCVKEGFLSYALPEGFWECQRCRFEDDSFVKAPVKNKLFAPLLHGLDAQNPRAFELTRDVIQDFPVVPHPLSGIMLDLGSVLIRPYSFGAEEAGGAFVVTPDSAQSSLGISPTYKPGPERRPHKPGQLIDISLCYKCRKAGPFASPVSFLSSFVHPDAARTSQSSTSVQLQSYRSPLIRCDECQECWHLDCLGPPLAAVPTMLNEAPEMINIAYTMRLKRGLGSWASTLHPIFTHYPPGERLHEHFELREKWICPLHHPVSALSWQAIMKAKSYGKRLLSLTLPMLSSSSSMCSPTKLTKPVLAQIPVPDEQDAEMLSDVQLSFLQRVHRLKSTQRTISVQDAPFEPLRALVSCGEDGKTGELAFNAAFLGSKFPPLDDTYQAPPIHGLDLITTALNRAQTATATMSPETEQVLEWLDAMSLFQQQVANLLTMHGKLPSTLPVASGDSQGRPGESSSVSVGTSTSGPSADLVSVPKLEYDSFIEWKQRHHE